MRRIFCVEFQRVPLKYHIKHLTHIMKDTIFMQCWKFKCPQINKLIWIFLNSSPRCPDYFSATILVTAGVPGPQIKPSTGTLALLGPLSWCPIFKSQVTTLWASYGHYHEYWGVGVGRGVQQQTDKRNLLIHRCQISKWTAETRLKDKEPGS